MKRVKSEVRQAWAFPWYLWKRIHLPVQETQVQSLGGEGPLEKETATHSSVPAWEIPCKEETGGLWSTVSQEGRHRPDSQHCNFLA